MPNVLLATTQDIAILIAAVSTALVTLIGAVFAGLAAMRAGQVHDAVKTSDPAYTLGQQVDNIASVQANADKTSAKPTGTPP